MSAVRHRCLIRLVVWRRRAPFKQNTSHNVESLKWFLTHPGWRKPLFSFLYRGGSTSCLQCVISIWAGLKRNPRHTWSTNHSSCKYFSFVKRNKPRTDVETHLVWLRRESRADGPLVSLRLQMLDWPPHGNFAHTARCKGHIQRRNLNERDWDLFAFLLSPPPDCCMCIIPCRLKVSHVVSRYQFGGGYINHPNSEQQMSKKRKSPDDQDFEDYPPAGTSDQGRSDGHKWECESWTVVRVQLCELLRDSLVYFFTFRYSNGSLQIVYCRQKGIETCWYTEDAQLL